MDSVAIKVDSLKKVFKLPHEQNTSIKSAVINFYKRKRTYELQKALKDISFEVKTGEFFGIVGRNGSGKSTLLKLLAGIYNPTEGNIEINGRLTPFIELGVGFNPELTGRENVFLNGALLGFNRREMKAMYKDIVDFAELKRFMGQKLKNYSSGMQVRLAFSIAIRAQSDILLIDEVLAVGDANFQKKCFQIFRQMKRDGKTVVFVSHDMKAVKEYCDRAILIENGELIAEGDTQSVIGKYIEINRSITDEELSRENIDSLKRKGNNRSASINKVWTSKSSGGEAVLFQPREPIVVNTEIKARLPLTDPDIVLQLSNPGSPPIFAASTRIKKISLNLKAGEQIKVKWEVPNILNDGTYLISVILLDQEGVVVHDQLIEAYKFEIEGWEYPYAMIHPKDNLTISKV